MKFRQPYDDNYNPNAYATDVGYELTDDPQKNLINMLESSKTEQAHADSCDVNLIVRQYSQTGLLKQVGDGMLQYGDISDLPTFQEAQNIVVAAKEAFAALPAKLRDRFHNDPQELMAFMDDPENFDEALKLGLVTKTSVAAEPSPEAAPQGAETPPAA